ncbi:MAG: quinone oxidoreductase [Dehalococcoidia bacterium]|nr:quinone oxidoreductase [Dehalococcoidia bacterium]
MVVREFGPVESLEAGDFPTPSPGPGDVLVRTSVAGINFADLGMVTGAAARREPPFVPGVEAAGVIEAASPDVEAAIGTRVVYWHPMPGAFAEFAAVPAWRTVAIPEGVSDSVAVALMVQGTTAHYLATDTFNLGPGHTCLVYAAAGGVGHLLVQLAVARGARVIGTVGSEDKVRLVRQLGAEVVINRGEANVLEAVRAATDGQGVDVVYDAVGAATIEQSIAATKRRGTCALYGAASGPVGVLDTALLQRAGSIFFTRPGLGDHMRDHDEYERRMTELFDLHLAGALVPHLGGEWPLEGAGEALSSMAAGRSTGKLLIRVGHSD